MKTNTLFSLTVLLIFACCFSACRKDSLFKDGKRKYSSKADQITVSSGERRIQIAITVSDPAIKKVVIYWNNRQNTKEIAADGTANAKVYTVLLTDMAEGDYSFEILTYDGDGNSSSPVTVIGTVYGEKYIQTLLNTPIKDVTFENGTATIKWGNIRENSLSTELVYTDNSNLEKTITIPLTATETKLENFKPGAIDAFFKYHTLYKTSNAALDNVYSSYENVAVITGSLKALASAKNILFGSLISYGGAAVPGFAGVNGVIYDGSPNGIYTQISSNEFNMGQAAWGPTRWSRDSPSNFNDVNAVINWNRQRYDKVFVHLILGRDVYMPSWFTTGTFTPTEMDDLLKKLVNEIMDTNDNKSKVDVWNVANEVFNADGTYRTPMKWSEMGWEDDASGLTGSDQINTKHPVFIGKAFQYCRQKTNALLELREVGIENDLPSSSSYRKHKAYYQLIKHMQAKGYPIDVVGIQAHFTLGTEPAGSYANFTNTIKKFKNLGLSVYLTELDDSSPKVNSQVEPWTPAMAEQQKQDYYRTVKAAIEGGVDLISLWGVRDNNDLGWKFDQSPLLFDENYNRKPAYYGVQRALYEAKK